MSETPRTSTRRRALAGAAVALAGATAGCAALRHRGIDDEDPPGDDGPPKDAYERLETVAVYVADPVDLTVPDVVETVAATNNADVLVLPGDTAVAADSVVEWLADGCTVALVGSDAEATWLDWERSDAFRDAFGDSGVGDAEPDPQLVVGAAVGTDASTVRRTWGSPPGDREVWGALDEALVDLAERTPR